MPPTPAALPDDVAALQALLLAERRRVTELEWDKLRLEQRLEAALRRIYGPRPDRLRSEAELGQMLLAFFEQLEQRPVPTDEPAAAVSEARRIRRRPGRRDLAQFDRLPVREIVHELSGEQRACPGCGAERVAIGQEESWQLEVIPARIERLRHLRVK